MIFICPYLITILTAWILAHVIKYCVSLYHKEHHTLRDHISRSGGMPSAHSASAVSLATLIGFEGGFGSGLFALAALFAAIVMYDALKVRRSSGEQGEAIQELIKATKSNIRLPRAAKGHTPLEVFVGAILGVLVGSIFFQIFS